MNVFKSVGNLVIINEDGTETVVGQPVPGSFQVVLNGKLMSEGVDYKVDYLTGSINLVGPIECGGDNAGVLPIRPQAQEVLQKAQDQTGQKAVVPAWKVLK